MTHASIRHVSVMTTVFIFFHSFIVFAQTFDLYEAKDKSSPILVYAHGGAWQSGKKSDYVALGKSLSTHGICVAVIEYRKSDQAKHPAPIEDLQTALGKLKSCDSSRIFLAGHSAGAHMIAFWNTVHESKVVKGLVGIEGIYDLPLLARDFPSYPDWFLKKQFGKEDASPVRREPRNRAPWLVLHSAKDELVNVAQSRGFADSLEKKKIPVRLVTLREGSHFGVVSSLENDSEARKELLAFIRANSTTP